MYPHHNLEHGLTAAERVAFNSLRGAGYAPTLAKKRVLAAMRKPAPAPAVKPAAKPKPTAARTASANAFACSELERRGYTPERAALRIEAQKIVNEANAETRRRAVQQPVHTGDRFSERRGSRLVRAL